MKIIAHRGASAYSPENSLDAIALAIEHGVDGIEFDIHFIHGQAFVMHDFSLARTHQQPYTLAELTPQQLTDYGVPVLDDVLQLIGQACRINIEIKSVDDIHAFSNYIQQLQHRHQLANDVIMSSFDHHILVALQRAGIKAQYGALIAHKPIDYAAYAQTLGMDIVAVEDAMVSAEFVQDAHARGKAIWVYTVDDVTFAKQLAQWGVDAIFTNDTLTMMATFKS